MTGGAASGERWNVRMFRIGEVGSAGTCLASRTICGPANTCWCVPIIELLETDRHLGGSLSSKHGIIIKSITPAGAVSSGPFFSVAIRLFPFGVRARSLPCQIARKVVKVAEALDTRRVMVY